MKIYVADFETTTEPYYNQYGNTRVWGACLVTLDKNPDVKYLGESLDDFMKVVSKDSCSVYFHNLKFDGEFIMAWLFKNGYKFSREKKEKTFDVMISDTGQWYQLTIIHKVYNKKYKKTTFYDSLKKIPLKVSQIAKAFSIEEKKGSIDYDVIRKEGYIMSEEEKEYIINDCVIVAKALHHQITEGLTKLTVGSDALSYFKETVGGKNGFLNLFPILPLNVDNDIRKSYKGGWCYVNPVHRATHYAGVSFDVNSLYPTVMYGKMGSLPYGVPLKFKGKYKPYKNYDLYIVKLSCYIKLKDEHLPTIQLKHTRSYLDGEYITESDGIIDLTLTNVDLELMFEHYHVENLEYYGGYMFKSSKNIFKPYIDYWGHIKATTTGGLRQLAKLMLNSLYGKFATNPIRQGKYPYVDEEGKIKLTLDEEVTKDPVYTAMSSFITAYARRYTITTAQKYYDRFIYADTDSISLIGYEAPKDLFIHNTELGGWKNEGIFEDSIFLRPKTYIKQKEGKINVTCAGMPDRVKKKVTFDNFTYGKEYKGKLTPKRVSGGVVLFNSTFTIKT